jgi:hypothetical protein
MILRTERVFLNKYLGGKKFVGFCIKRSSHTWEFDDTCEQKASQVMAFANISELFIIDVKVVINNSFYQISFDQLVKSIPAH